MNASSAWAERLLIGVGRLLGTARDSRDWSENFLRFFAEQLDCQSLLLLAADDCQQVELVDDQPAWTKAELPELEEAILVGGDDRLPGALDARLLQLGCGQRLHLPLLVAGNKLGVLALGASTIELRPLVDVLTEAARLLAVDLDRLRAHDDNRALRARLTNEADYRRDELRRERDLRLLAGDSIGMKRVRQAIQQVAGADSTVLILGETGTGKELVARAVHQLSPRRERMLVAVNCAALAPALVASELFGHEQGAFTGAVKRRVGRFELAQHGSLFLDEIGELSPENQVLLLRVLQERAVERVGGNQPIAVDVRVIAATHRDLEADSRAGQFRADLFYRLNVFPIRLPPLRERGDDIGILVEHFLKLFNRRLNRRVTSVRPDALDLLRRYHWPGNVRELENVIERAMIVSKGAELEIDRSWFRPDEAAQGADGSSLAATERQAIVAALARANGKIYGADGAAALLGLKPSTLYGKMRKLNIPRATQHGA